MLKEKLKKEHRTIIKEVAVEWDLPLEREKRALRQVKRGVGPVDKNSYVL